MIKRLKLENKADPGAVFMHESERPDEELAKGKTAVAINWSFHLLHTVATTSTADRSTSPTRQTQAPQPQYGYPSLPFPEVQ